MARAATSEEIRPPSMFLALAELHRAAVELGALAASAPILATAPRGDGHSVMVLPGFIASSVSTEILRAYLGGLGYEAHDWALGRNIGPRVLGRNGERLTARLDTIYQETGRKVSLIGWSLGGVMARELAMQRPEAVRQVITLGAPFTGNPRATTIAALYEAVSGEKLGGAHERRRMRRGNAVPPAPSTAIFSKSDGIVAWRNCIEPCAALTDNIEVCGSHCGLVANPAVLYAIADRLAQPEGEWAPFDRSGVRAAFFPTSGHLH